MNSTLRVLHLEDDPHDAEIVRDMLDGGGLDCDIRRVETREAFNGALAEGGFDLILADFSLPLFDGLSALHIALERSPDVPFIFVSGVLGEELAIEAVKVGATDYVLKQRLSRLVSAVQRALRESRTQRERKQAEQRLRRSEAFLAEGQRISHVGSWGCVIGTGKGVWSDEHYRVLGLEPGSVEPSVERFLSVVHPEDQSRVRRILDLAWRTRRAYAVEFRVVLPDGSARHLRSMGRPVPACDDAGTVDEFIGTTADITECVEAAAALRARQELLDLAQQAARAVAFELRLGADTAQDRWSPDLAAMFGLAPDHREASFLTWQRRIHPNDWPAVRDALTPADRSGDIACEFRVVHCDGSVHWLQAKGRRLLDAHGRPTRTVGFMLDVTDRHEAEQEKRRLEARLRQAQRLEALGTLAGGIAHDFNNILGAILGYGERATLDVARGTRLRRNIENILAAGERGRALVDRVLAFSRGGGTERTAVHVEAVVEETLDLVGANLPRNIAIHPTLQAGRAALEGDPTQVHQVLMNLATNAIQAMPDGGTLGVSLTTIRNVAGRTMAIGTIAAGDYVVLEVTDTGTGIAPDVLDRIFDPFFTTKEVGVGNGLGLSLVHGIVTDVGGAIDVRTIVGAGATFTVYFPRTGDAPHDGDRVSDAVPRGLGQRVLFVDDEEPLVQLATETLAELGYAPVGFTSSLAALDAFRADPEGFDVVVTDERMPGLTGSALIREVRSIRQSVPTLLVSGYVSGATGAGGNDIGVDAILKKPLSARDLATSLARVLHAGSPRAGAKRPAA